MSTPASVTASIQVAVKHDVAFEVFTEEIDSWYKRDQFTLFDADRAVAIRFEPHVGGRLLEVYDEISGEGREMGRITVWDPGRTLTFIDNHDTEIEVTFEPSDDGTWVILEHRGLDRVPPDERAQVREYGWRIVLPWFTGYLERHACP